jgi:HEAT repeat protein
MGSKGAQKALPALTKALSDTDAEVRRHSAWALGKLGSAAKDAVEALRKAAKDENKDVRFNAINALKQIEKK